MPGNVLIENVTGRFPEAGTDEAGRGALAGPVVAAAVVLPPAVRLDGLRDSKKLSAAQRLSLRDKIIERCEGWCLGMVGAPEIDRVNILRASLAAMREAVEGLNVAVAAVAADGKFVFAFDKPVVGVVKGDDKCLHIAAASVLAKTFRDEIMTKLDELYPQYGWRENKGYPTAAHLEALRRHGLSPFHRRSYKPCSPTLFGAKE